MVPALGLASGIGGRRRGSGDGPLFIRKYLGSEFLWQAMIAPEKDTPTDSYEAIASLNRSFAKAVYHTALSAPFLLSVGGDHSSAIGTWSGVAAANRTKGKIGLLWIDAHMDAHTPQTTESGNIHGMPLAALLGHGDKRFTELLDPHPKISPESTALIGVRSFESGEAALLKDLDVRIYFIDEVQKRGIRAVLQEAHSLVSRETVGYGVSFDLDSLDPKEIQAVGTPEPNGLGPEETLAALSDLLETSPPLAFELVEYDPHLDVELKTLAFIGKLVQLIKRSAVDPARI